MAQPQDLMSLGENPYLAARVATTVNTSFTAFNSTYALAAANTLNVIGGNQFLTVVFTASNSGIVILPVIGGALGCLLGDDFVVHNGSNTSIYCYVNTGGSINISGFSAANSVIIAPYKTITLWPIYNTGTGASNTGYWVGVASA
jgi:hypothetical protein